jgi:nucleotide-binding universal stress UspA family protein
MFKKILVPLDGSALAEQALAPAAGIAQKFGGSLVLLRVVTPERALPGFPYLAARSSAAPAILGRPLVAEAEAYLASVRLPAGVPCRTRVLTGAAPEMIISAATEEAVNLIVMSTHGRAGITRLLYGSVAEAVLRGATVPVLLVPSRVFARLSPEEQELASQPALAGSHAHRV